MPGSFSTICFSWCGLSLKSLPPRIVRQSREFSFRLIRSQNFPSLTLSRALQVNFCGSWSMNPTFFSLQPKVVSRHAMGRFRVRPTRMRTHRGTNTCTSCHEHCPVPLQLDTGSPESGIVEKSISNSAWSSDV